MDAYRWRELQQVWKMSPLTASKNMSIVKAFFEFALTNEWIERDPARMMKNPRLRAGGDHRTRERLPFTDEELKRIERLWKRPLLRRATGMTAPRNRHDCQLSFQVDRPGSGVGDSSRAARAASATDEVFEFGASQPLRLNGGNHAG